MQGFKRILCPVDLSENSLAIIDWATTFAKQHDAKLIFLFSEPIMLADEAMLGYLHKLDPIQGNKVRLEQLRPSDPSVAFEHLYANGNPGPAIVRAAADCELIVMSTHGHSGILRMLMGSVAEYTLRHAPCPVLIIREPTIKTIEHSRETTNLKPHEFATKVMQHVRPVHAFDRMEHIIKELSAAAVTAAPVTDSERHCIGILTQTDIELYHDLKRRYQARDESVLSEIFETDEMGMRRIGSNDFEHVERHMTSPVLTISNSASCQQASEMFKQNSKIHHLVVVDEFNRALGILDSRSTNDSSNTAPLSSESQP